MLGRGARRPFPLGTFAVLGASVLATACFDREAADGTQCTVT
jgi:hypothetical protein